MEKRAQSALEYLMTYGWALVVIVIVIAALFAFGIFNPPSAGTCTGLNKLAYVQHSTANGIFYLRASNGAGSQISITDVNFTSNNNAVTYQAVSGTNFPATTINSASNIDLNSSGGSGGFSSGTYSQRVTIAYTQSGIPHVEVATCTGNA